MNITSENTVTGRDLPLYCDNWKLPTGLESGPVLESPPQAIATIAAAAKSDVRQ